MSRKNQRWYERLWQIVSVIIIAVIVFVPEFIAGEKEIIIKDSKGISFPFMMNDLQYYKTIADIDPDWSLNPIIPFDPLAVQTSEPALAAPMTVSGTENMRHILGTDHLGRDVLSGMIYGLKTALIVGLGATIIALVIGVFLGMISSFYAEHPMLFHPILGIGILLGISVVLWSLIWAIKTGYYIEYLLFGIVVSIASISISYYIQSMSSYRIKVPIDAIIQSIADLFSSIPALVLLLAFVPFFVNSSIWLVVLVIGFVRWPVINRYTRAEAISIQSKEWVTQLRRWNMPTFKLLFKYILKELRAPIFVLAIFSIGSAVVLEATLSFLGLGYGIEQASWGAMMSNARDYPQAWWLVVFPGIAITAMMITLNIWARNISDKQYIQQH